MATPKIYQLKNNNINEQIFPITTSAAIVDLEPDESLQDILIQEHPINLEQFNDSIQNKADLTDLEILTRELREMLNEEIDYLEKQVYQVKNISSLVLNSHSMKINNSNKIISLSLDTLNAGDTLSYYVETIIEDQLQTRIIDPTAGCSLFIIDGDTNLQATELIQMYDRFMDNQTLNQYGIITINETISNPKLQFYLSGATSFTVNKLSIIKGSKAPDEWVPNINDPQLFYMEDPYIDGREIVCKVLIPKFNKRKILLNNELYKQICDEYKLKASEISDTPINNICVSSGDYIDVFADEPSGTYFDYYSEHMYQFMVSNGTRRDDEIEIDD